MTSLRVSFGVLLIALSGHLSAEPMPRVQSAHADGADEKLPEHAAARLGSLHFRHGGPISSLAVSADGKHIASGSHDGSVRIWEADTGKLLRAIPCDVAAPAGVAFSSDGDHLLTNIDGGHLHVFEWATDKQPRTIVGSIAQWLFWSKDGKYFGGEVADEDSVQIRDAASGKVLHTFKKATRVAFAADGKTCAVAQLGGEIKLIAIEDEKELKSFATPEESGNVTDVRFSADDRLLIAAHVSGSIAVWDVETVKRLYTLAAAGPVALVPGQPSLAAIEKGHLAIFDLKTGERKLRVAEALDEAPFVFFPDGNRIAIGGPGNRVRIWNLTSGKEITFGEGHEGEVTGLIFTPDGKSLLSGGADGLRLWDLLTGRERAATRRTVPVQAISRSPTGRSFATSDRKMINIWAPIDFSKDKPYAERPTLVIPTDVERAPILLHSPDGQRIVFADADKKLVFADPRRATTFPGLALAAAPLAAAFNPNGRYLAVHTRDGWLRHWMVSERNDHEIKDVELWTKRVQRGSRGAVAYSPEGLVVAVFSAGRVVLLDSVSGQQWHGFEREFGEGDVQALAYSPDGNFIAAGHAGPAGFVRVWEVLTGKVVATFRGHTGGVNTVAFSPDGKHCASAGSDTTILLWNLTMTPTSENKPMTPAEAWEALDSQDMKTSYRAMKVLMSAGPKSIALIENGAKEAVASQKRVQEWIRQLEDDDFRVRKAARAALANEGARALPSLHEVLAKKPPVDTERQARLLIEEMDARDIRIPESGLFGETLRTIRSIRVLEHVGGPDAIRMLEKLADANDDSRAAADAKSALEHLRR